MESAVPEKELAPLRDEIDRIDSQILELVNQRLEVGRKVGNIKKEKGSQVLDRSREKRVMENLFRQNQGPADQTLLRYLFNVIIRATRDIQKPKTISYLGPKGGFPHRAAMEHFHHCGEYLSQPSLEELFREVEKNESHFGVVPVENSMEGTVAHTLDLFAEYDLKITGEHYSPVTHDLVSITGNTQHLKSITATPRVLDQCRRWLGRKFPHIKLVAVSSDLDAVATAQKDPDTGALIPGETSAVHDLLPIETQVQDGSGNVTRYLIIGRETPRATGNDKTSVMFAVPHQPGALFQALKPVETAGMNMLKLESRPTRKEKWHYYFFLDLAGHISDDRVAETIDLLKANTLTLKILGAYPAHPEEGN